MRPSTSETASWKWGPVAAVETGGKSIVKGDGVDKKPASEHDCTGRSTCQGAMSTLPRPPPGCVDQSHERSLVLLLLPAFWPWKPRVRMDCVDPTG